MRKVLQAFFAAIGYIAYVIFVIVFNLYAWLIMFPVEVVRVVFGYEYDLKEEQEKRLNEQI